MDDPTIFDIAIVGGGLAGLLAAARLAGPGRSVALVAPPRHRDGRTTALLGESIEALRGVGAWDVLAPVAQPIRSIRLIDATEGVVRAPEVRFDAGEIGLEAFGYNIPNEALLAALEGIVLTRSVRRFDDTASRIVPRAAAVDIDTKGAEALSASLVVAADGRNSACRAAAGIGFDPKQSLNQAALVTSFSHRLAHDDVSTEFHTGSGPFTLVPLPGRRSALVWVTTVERAEELKQLEQAQLASAIETNARSILGEISEVDQVQIFRLASGSASRLGAERIALIGEAAHVLPPIAAQGFNLTVRDIAVLAELAGDTQDPGAPELLDEYDRRRGPDLGVRAVAVGLLNRSLVSRSPAVKLVRSAGLHALSMVPALRRGLIRQGLGIG